MNFGTSCNPLATPLSAALRAPRGRPARRNRRAATRRPEASRALPEDSVRAER